MKATIAVYAGAALTEIAGCFAVWAVVRLGHSAWWLVPGVATLRVAWLLTLSSADAAGRAFAAYGGIYRRVDGVDGRRGSLAADAVGRGRRGARLVGMRGDLTGKR